MTNYSFPSLGRTIRFAVDVLGVLPRKRSDNDGLDETDKKRIQKKLLRLANEEGRLEDNIDEIVAELSEILGRALNNDEIRFAICETLWDIYEDYNTTIKSDGTYLSERETIEWFCISLAIPRLAFSVPKHMLRANLAGRGLIYPSDKDWYLPSIADGRITWPLAKTMHWIYQTFDVRQERFHYPNRGTANEDVHNKQRQNLENAREWTKGNNTPSWSGLRWNFSYAFDGLAACQAESDRRDLPAALRENLYYILFIARFSTDLCKRIERSHGLVFLEQCIAKYQQHRQWLTGEVETHRLIVEEVIEETKDAGVPHDVIWCRLSDEHWRLLADRMTKCGERMRELLMRGGQMHDVRGAEGELIHQFREYPVRFCLSFLDEQTQNEIPDGFVEAFNRALELKSSETTEPEVDEYEADLKQRDLEKRLMWIPPWLRAVIRYKNEDYEGAFQFAEIAFNYAKYSAGREQYNLVNLYVELAAKNRDKKRFKKGVEWARFIGLKIRWLRDAEPTDENLDLAFEMLGKAQYFQF